MVKFPELVIAPEVCSEPKSFIVKCSSLSVPPVSTLNNVSYIPTLLFPLKAALPEPVIVIFLLLPIDKPS